MKKVLAIVAIAAFAACNNAPSESAAVDSAKIKDSMMKAEKMKMDTPMVKKDTMTTMSKDTAAKKM